jgi:hypothetical protein
VELRDAYRVLDIYVGANDEVVREARKTLAKVWHPDRHVNDPELARKAQSKLADINTAFEIIRSAKFPAQTVGPSAVAVPNTTREGRPPIDEPARGTSPDASSQGRTASPPSSQQPRESHIEFVPRQRVRWSVLVLVLAAAGVGAYLAVAHVFSDSSRAPQTSTAQTQPTPPPMSQPPATQPAPVTQPAPSQPQPTTPLAASRAFGLGSSQREVRDVQGEPSQVLEMLHQWHYGFSTVTFDRGVVREYWNVDGNLHVALQPHEPAVAARATAAGVYAVGASKDEVVALDGTPTRVSCVVDETWGYPDGSSVTFDDDGHVTAINNFGGNLHVRR